MSPKKKSRQPPRRRPVLSAFALSALLFTLSLTWFTIRIGEPPFQYFDEKYYAFTASEYAQSRFDPRVHAKGPDPRTGASYVWNHPPLGMLLIAAGISVWGDVPLGWRFPSAVFGALGVVAAYGLALGLSRSRRVALLTACFLMLDGLYFVHARIGMIDVFVTVFLLGALLGLHAVLRSPVHAPASRRALVGAGACIGLGLATKWSAAFAGTLIGLAVLARMAGLLPEPRSRTRGARGAPDPRPPWGWVAIALGLVPAAIYLAAHLPFLLSGRTLGDFLVLQKLMLSFHAALAAAHEHASSWWQWPLAWRSVLYVMLYGTDTASGTVAWAAKISGNGNPLLYWMFLPAIAYVTFAWWRERRAELIVLWIGFFGQWLPWALVPRITYVYYFLPAVPFGCLALAVLVSDGIGRSGLWRIAAIAYVALVAAAFGFFYPTWAAVPISPEAQELRLWFESWR